MGKLGPEIGPHEARKETEQAAALARALRLDNEARQMFTAGFNVTAVNESDGE